MAQSFTRQQLEAWLKTIDVVGSTLDIGGAQHNIKGRTKSWDVDDYKVLDLEQPHQGAKPDIIWDMNIDFDFMMSKYYDKFDNIFAIEVMEYIYDPVTFLYNCLDCLKSGGLLYISTHFIYPEHLPIGTDMLRYTPSGIVKLIESVGEEEFYRGFEIIENIPRIAKVNFAEAWSIEGMRGWKDFDTKIIGNLICAKKK